MNVMSHTLCSIQARLFELSARHGFESDAFIRTYMNSDVAAKFNSAYDRSQWMGEEYLLDEMIQTYQLERGKTYSRDVMFWMGYTYAYWSIVYGDSCKRIIGMVAPKSMAENYAGLHTVSMDIAVQDLQGQYWARGNNTAKLREEVYKRVIKDALNSRVGTTDYHRFVNEAGTDILFALKNEVSRREYQRQIQQYRRYVTNRMFDTYIDYIFDLISKANVSLKEKTEYTYLVRDTVKNALISGFTIEQFRFLDSLITRLK